MPRKRLLIAVLGLALSVVPIAGASDLSTQIAAGRRAAGTLSSRVAAESARIQGYEGTLGSLNARLALLQRSIVVQQRVLGSVRVELATDRIRLRELQRDYTRDRTVLAAQMLSRYESPPPTVLDVIVNAHGFNGLLNGVAYITRIAREDASATARVKSIRAALSVQAQRLYRADAGKLRQEAAIIGERDQIAELKLSIVDRELRVSGQRRQDLARLSGLRRTLAGQTRLLSKQAAAAEIAAYKDGGSAPGGCVNTPFVAHGGPYGLFLAPGTNYTVNQEPVIAARLDTLGKALGLHLIGISGYRSPAHSVEVGGFADDPHTRGQASDTPGIEGVPESTLERFCLTRPFPGPREADHIQEL